MDGRSGGYVETGGVYLRGYCGRLGRIRKISVFPFAICSPGVTWSCLPKLRLYIALAVEDVR